MVHEPEFVRGNQKSYIRMPHDDVMSKSYEYQMCSYNRINSLVPFQARSQNGCEYLYYEISGMQSLDIYLQTQKLKRPFVIQLAKAIIKLCRELSEYALDIEKVIFAPRYIMIDSKGEEILFLYAFSEEEKGMEGAERLLESCIECLDYQDELLMEKLYGIYERLLEQKENFLLETEMDTLRDALTEQVVVDISGEIAEPRVTVTVDDNWEPIGSLRENANENMFRLEENSKVAQKEYRGLKRGVVSLFLLDMAVLIVWKPLTLLKVFFVIAVGIVLAVLGVRVCRKERKGKEMQQLQEQDEMYMEEYENLAMQSNMGSNYTQFIVIEDTEGVLHNLQGYDPKCIYIKSNQQIIGKDPEKAQIQIVQEGISRVHALVVKEDQVCIIEDLNSTNGTWVNGKALEPRKRYVLQQGDKVRFAGAEYIFR